MKKNLLYVLMLLCSTSLLVACSNDDGEKKAPVGDEVTGVYLGMLDIKSEDLPLDDAGKNIPQKIYITKTADNSLELQLKDFSFAGLTIGTIKVENCAAEKTEGGYAFTGAQKVELVVGPCDVQLSGTIVGKKLDVAIKVVAAGLNIDVEFAGNKLDKDLSSEAKILTFKIEHDKVLGEAIISEEDHTIKLNAYKGMTDEELSTLVPEFTISTNATVTPNSGEKQDFSAGKKVVYTVTSEDGVVVKEYEVSVNESILHYSFDVWGTKKETIILYSGVYPIVASNDWSSSNAALIPISGMKYYPKGDYPIVEVDGVKGKAASITTLNTTGGVVFGQRIPKITAGTLFTGVFEINMTAPLKSTKFGIPFFGEPVSLKGYYKYTPGADYYQKGETIDKAEIDGTKHDECSIVAVLYEGDILDGSNINNGSNVVLRAELYNGETITEWKEINIPFTAQNGFVYDSSKSYKLAIVCSSSRYGDNYSGAPGSVLTIDEFEIVTK